MQDSFTAPNAKVYSTYLINQDTSFCLKGVTNFTYVHIPCEGYACIHPQNYCFITSSPEDAYPAQLPYNGIQYEWIEDTRLGYEKTAVVNITWEPPEGYQYISSYDLVMFSQTDECGGHIRMMSFMGIGNVRICILWHRKPENPTCREILGLSIDCALLTHGSQFLRKISYLVWDLNRQHFQF